MCCINYFTALFGIIFVVSIENVYSKDDKIITSDSIFNSSSNSTIIKPFLLPNTLKPKHYKLEVIPLLFEIGSVETFPFRNISLFSAPGKVSITVRCIHATSNITLHAHESISIDKDNITVINVQTGDQLIISNVTRDKDTDFLVLHLENEICSYKPLHEELYIVDIAFVAQIGADRLNGLYLDYYVDPQTQEKRYLSTTLFAPNHARKAFPCWDEPGFKATFNISIGRKTNSTYTSISNMPISRSLPIPELSEWTWDVFEETVPLPTYIVAMITTDFGYRSVKIGDVEIRLNAPKHLLARTKQLNYTDSMTNYPYPYLLQDPLLTIQDQLENFPVLQELGKYPLKKLDVVALPHFFFSAMENMGAMTFKYPIILNVEHSTTTSELLRVASVAGHEVTHQWFGNMMTPKSWTYVWLKESFSDLFGKIYVSQKLDSDGNTDSFVNDELQRALKFDGEPDTHPLENPLKSATSVGEIYSDIPYRKGASVMYMTANFLSFDIFIKGLKKLFAANKFGNIDQNDLFDALEDSQLKHNILGSQSLNNVTVSDILNTWTKQSGYPVVRVRRQGSSYMFRQEKFKNQLIVDLKSKIESLNETMDDDEQKMDGFWWIPIITSKTIQIQSHYTNQINNQSVYWLPPDNSETAIPQSAIVNINFIQNTAGYFRILYSNDEFSHLLQSYREYFEIRKTGTYSKSGWESTESFLLQPVERSQLLDNYFAFAFAKYPEVSVNTLFNLMSATLPFEGEYVVWNTLSTNIIKLFQLLKTTKHFESFQSYFLRLLKPLYNYLQSQLPTAILTPCSQSSATNLARTMQLQTFYSLISSWVCKFDPHECAHLSRKAMTKFMETGHLSSIPADDQQRVYCNAVRTASDNELDAYWTFFEKQYFGEYYPVQKDRYLKALSCTKKPDYIQKLLSWTTNNTIDLHDVDRVTLLKFIVANSLGREHVLEYLDNNFEALYKSQSVANPVVEGFKAMVEYCNSDEKLKNLESFMEKHSEAMTKQKKSLDKQIRKCKLNILWMESFAEDIEKSASAHLKNKFLSQEECAL